MRGRKPSASYGPIDKQIRELYLVRGLSLNAIARKLEIHPETVKRRCKSMGIKIRTHKESLDLYNWRTDGEEETEKNFKG
jgi:DNA-binding CsgD family transcriptional regulator